MYIVCAAYIVVCVHVFGGVTCCGMCYPVCGMVHIKEPLLLIGKSSHVAAAGFLSLSEWSFTICPTLYNRK